MHELGITQSLVNMAVDTAKANAAKKVLTMRIAMGELSTYETTCIKEYFAMLTEETLAEGCELEFRFVPARIFCPSCQKEFTPKHYSVACPDCGTYKTQVLEGRELYIENIEIETDESIEMEADENIKMETDENGDTI